MESLAAMTGGQSLAPEQLPELIKRLTRADLDPGNPTRDQKNLLGHLALLPDDRLPAEPGLVSAQEMGIGLRVPPLALWERGRG